MSKIEAYRCDYCGCATEYEDIYGAISPQEDLMDKLHSYPSRQTEAQIKKGEIHVCVSCCRKNAIIPASNMANPRTEELKYNAKLLELMYGVRAQCVRNHRNRQRSKK